MNRVLMGGLSLILFVPALAGQINNSSGAGGVQNPTAGGGGGGGTVLPIWIDPRTYGAKCDGTTDDTAALNAAAGATATLSGAFAPWGLYIPNIGFACTTTTGIAMPASNFPVLVNVAGTLRATASITTLISVNSTSPLPVTGAITGSGTIDANGLAQNAVWIHQCQKFDVRDVKINNGTVSAVRVGDTSAGTKCTAYVDHTDDVVYNLTVSPPAVVAKTTGSVGILSDDTTDSHYDNNTIVGYDIGLLSTGGSAKVQHNHCWGHTGQVPSTCYLATAGGTYWLDDYADGFLQYGFHLERFNDIVDAPQVFCNPTFCPANTAVGIQFDQTAPFAIITNGQFNGSSSTPLAADINVPVSANALITSGNLATFTTVVNSQAEQSFQAATFHSVAAQTFIVGGTSIGAPITQTSQINSQGSSPLVGIVNGGYVHFSGGVFPSLSCLSQVLTPTISGGVITFPSNGTNSSGDCLATDANGNTTLIDIPNSGATPATLDLSTWTVPQPPSTFIYHQVTGVGQHIFNATNTAQPCTYDLRVSGTSTFCYNLAGHWVLSGPIDSTAFNIANSSFLGSMQGTLSGNRTYTFPDQSGTVGLVLKGTTGTITGTALSATCDAATVTVTGAVAGQPVSVSSTTGADVGGAFNLRASVTAANTVSVFVCGTGTPASLAYNVVVHL